MTRRHFLRSQYFTFTHNLRKLIGKRREMKTFTMSHKSSTRSHYSNFKIRGTFDPTVSRLEKGTHTHIHTRAWNCQTQTMNEDNLAFVAQTTRITSICYCINLNLILNTVVPSSNGIFFGQKMSNIFRSVRNIFNVRLCKFVYTFIYNFMRRETLRSLLPSPITHCLNSDDDDDKN